MTPTPLPGFLAGLSSVLDHYGYFAVAGLVFVEDFGVPLPGETILIAAAVEAGTGRLNVLAVALVGFAAAVAGDNLGYLIGRTGGRSLLHRFGRPLRLTPERLDQLDHFIDGRGGLVVIVARFIEGLRQANGLVAGAIGMSWLRFLLFNMLGAALWVAVWVSLGAAAGTHIDAIYRAMNDGGIYILVGLAVLLAAFLLWRHRRHRSRAATQDEPVRREGSEPGPSEPA